MHNFHLINALRNLNMLKLSAVQFYFECKNKNRNLENEYVVVTDVTICARWEFWILIQSISFLCWIRTVKIQTTFQTTNDISWVLCYTLMRSYFSDSEFWSHFLRKMDGFKEIMCFVVNLVTIGYWDFFFFPSSSKLCFLHLHRFQNTSRRPNVGKMSAQSL